MKCCKLSQKGWFAQIFLRERCLEVGWEDGEAEVFRWVFPVRHEGPGGSSVKSGEQFCTSRVRVYILYV